MRTGTVNGVIDLPVLTKDGYTFKGWNTEENGRGTAFDAGTAVHADLTVYAQWELNKNKSGADNDAVIDLVLVLIGAGALLLILILLTRSRRKRDG